MVSNGLSKKQFIVIVVSFVLVFASIFIVAGIITGLLPSPTTIFGDEDTFNYDYWETLKYTDTIYVHPDGDNNDGDSWETAYKTLNLAIVSVSDDDNDFTLILIAPNVTYDVGVSGALEIDKQVHIRGHRYGFTRFENNHVNATAVFNITNPCILEDFSVECGTGSNDGVVLDTGSVGTEIRSIMVYSQSVTGDNSGFKLQDCDKIALDEAMVVGNTAYTCGVEVVSSLIFRFDDVRTYFCKVGVCFKGASASYAIISSITAALCATGIQIDTGTIYLVFINVYLYQNTLNIDDDGSNISWNGIHTDAYTASLIPDDLTGVTVNAGVGASVYGNWTQVRSAGAKPYNIVRIGFEPSAKELYQIELSVSNGTTIIFSSVIEGYGIGEFQSQEIPAVFCNQGTTIYCRIRSETGGNSIQMWLQIVEI